MWGLPARLEVKAISRPLGLQAGLVSMPGEVVSRRRLLASALATVMVKGTLPMPVYEYICRKCGKKFMEVMRISELERKKLHCPKCRSAQLEKCLEPFFAVTSKKS